MLICSQRVVLKRYIGKLFEAPREKLNFYSQQTPILANDERNYLAPLFSYGLIDFNFLLLKSFT